MTNKPPPYCRQGLIRSLPNLLSQINPKGHAISINSGFAANAFFLAISAKSRLIFIHLPTE